MCTQRVVRSSADMDKHAQDVARKAARQGYDASRVDASVSYANSADTGLQATHLLTTAMNTCRVISWHSSYRWATGTTQSERRWGDSMVVPLDKPGNSFYGKLQLAMPNCRRWPTGHSLLGFLTRTEHELTRADDYAYLLALANHEIPLHAASGMLVQ